MNLRWKHCPQFVGVAYNDTDDNVVIVDGKPCVLQALRMFDEDSKGRYYHWETVRIVDDEASDYEEELTL